jgi:hypothetical protein
VEAAAILPAGNGHNDENADTDLGFGFGFLGYCTIGIDIR